MQLSVRSESKYQGMKAGDKAMVVPPLHNTLLQLLLLQPLLLLLPLLLLMLILG